MIDLDFEDLSDEEINELLIYAESDENIESRYKVACQIIANMIKELKVSPFSNSEMVDMTICKMLIDGYIEVEKKPLIFH